MCVQSTVELPVASRELSLCVYKVHNVLFDRILSRTLPKRRVRAGQPRGGKDETLDPPHATDAGEFEQGKQKPKGKIRGRLLAAAAFWRITCVSSVVLSWILTGFPLPFAGSHPAPRQMANQPSAFEHDAFVTEAIRSLVETDAAGPVSYVPTVVSPLGVVAKKSSGKLRLIINMRYLNSHLQKRKFKYETVSSLSLMLERNDYMWSLDISSAYHHISVAESDWPFMGFAWKGQHYVFKSLPFGLSVACWVFTKFSREFVGSWRASGIKVLPYMDDFLFAGAPRDATDFSSMRATRDRVLSDLRAGGLLVNHEKSLLDFTQSIEHLGVGIDTVEGVFFSTPNRWDRFQSTVASAMAYNRRRVPVKVLASVAGQAVSLRVCMGPVSRMFTRSLYKLIESAPTWRSHLTRTDEVNIELGFFASLKRLKYAQPIWSASWRSVPVALRLFVDASDSGWGGFIDGVASSEARGYFTSEERILSSTWREVRGLLELLRSHVAAIRGKTILVFTDNQNVERYFAAGGCSGSKTHKLHIELLAIFWFCVASGITLTVQWIPRDLNEKADYLSKIVDIDDWKLHPSLFSVLDARWGPHSVDRFATHTNALCPRFNSWYWCPGTSGLDAFAQPDWLTTNNWCNPPFRLIGRLISLVRELGAVATIIVPVWPGQSWWHQLCPDGSHLAADVVDMCELPQGFDTFLPGVHNANTAGVGTPTWRVIAVRFDCRPGAPEGRRWRIQHRRN